jgi:hypothetical protein
MLMASVLTAMTLASCATSGTAKLPALPADLAGCFDRLVGAPAKGALTQGQVFTLIAELRKSEAAKSQCGKRLIAFYDGLRG